MAIDIEALKKMTPEQRAQLWINASKKLDKGGAEIIELLKSSGLPLRSGGLSAGDPVHIRLEEIIWSKEAQQKMVAATKSGLPALSGVEKMIVEDLGDQYGKFDLGTATAGSIVAEVMRFLGYKILKGDVKMPEGSVAKTAALWS